MPKVVAKQADYSIIRRFKNGMAGHAFESVIDEHTSKEANDALI